MFSGDIHLGRSPHRLAASGLIPADYGPEVALIRLVDEAIARRVEAVVLAGDVVDEPRDRFEAFGVLERAARRLSGAGIALYAVAGNHDGDVLPRLAARVEGFRLLGAGGIWERVAVPGAGRVSLLGWSFPTRVVRESPLGLPSLAAALEGRAEEEAVLGVVHGDLDAAESSYAPLSTRALERVPVDGWLLGHVHQPGALSVSRPVGYLGSLVGLDRGEPGLRGPWLVEVRGRGRLSARQLALGPVLWRPLSVDLTGVEPTAEALGEALLDRLVGARAEAPPRVDLIACSVRLEGSPLGRAQPGWWEALSPERLLLPGRPAVAVVAVEDHTSTRRPLAELARIGGPIGVLAGLLERLEGGGPLPEGLDLTLGAARRWPRQVEEAPLPGDRELLLEAGRRMLDRLLAQLEEVR